MKRPASLWPEWCVMRESKSGMAACEWNWLLGPMESTGEDQPAATCNAMRQRLIGTVH